MAAMETERSLVQIAERLLADAEEAYRLDPSDANERRVWKAWSAVRRARERTRPPEAEPSSSPDD
jgi:hypothetical protein